MSRSFWHEQRIGDVLLSESVCLPIATTLADAKFKIDQLPGLIGIGLSDERDQCIGVVQATLVLMAHDHLGSAALLSEIKIENDAVLCEEELIPNAVMRFSSRMPAIFAVTKDGVFRGLLASSDLLAYVVQHHVRMTKDSSYEVSALSNQFVSHVAHDIRNPLSIISAACGLLEHSASKPDQFQRYIDLIRRASKQALQVSDGLINMERYAYEEKISPASVSLQQFMEDVCAENCELVQYRGQTLVIESCDAGIVKLDPYLIKRALLNLIDNACKHSKQKGNVRLSAKVSGNKSEKLIDFTVRDDGPGIGKNDSDQVFKPFLQLDTDKQALGYGLGLTIAKRFSQFHRGSIRAQNIQPKGMAFILSIPFVPG